MSQASIQESQKSIDMRRSQHTTDRESQHN